MVIALNFSEMMRGKMLLRLQIDILLIRYLQTHMRPHRRRENFV